MNGRGLAAVLQELSALLDTGLYDGLSLDEIYAHIQEDRILEFLSELGGTDTDFSVLLKTNTYGEFSTEYCAKLAAIMEAYRGDERRKWGVENRGLCLLISWTAELLRDPETDWQSLAKN